MAHTAPGNMTAPMPLWTLRPAQMKLGCVETAAWAVAAAAGLVVRTGPGLVVLDLDGDGHEQTGWVLVYLHLATKNRIPLGSWVAAGDPLGHPSCEGGYPPAPICILPASSTANGCQPMVRCLSTWAAGSLTMA